LIKTSRLLKMRNRGTCTSVTTTESTSKSLKTINLRLNKKNQKKLREVALEEAEVDSKTSMIVEVAEEDSTSVAVAEEAEAEVIAEVEVAVADLVATVISTLMKTLETKIFSPKRRKNTSTWTTL
jgi:hypothetical protein